jgi:hypothetical protein
MAKSPYRDPLLPLNNRIRPDRRRRIDITIAIVGAALGALVCFGGTRVAEERQSSGSNANANANACGGGEPGESKERHEVVSNQLELITLGPSNLSDRQVRRPPRPRD